MYIKKIAILLFFSISFSQYFGGNISIGGAFPQGEFKNQEVPSSFAIDLNALYYLNDYAAFEAFGERLKRVTWRSSNQSGHNETGTFVHY